MYGTGYKECISGAGINPLLLDTYYSFSSGISGSAQTPSVLLNEIYTIDQSITGGTGISSKNVGFLVKNEISDSSVISGGAFSGTEVIQIGDTVNFSKFSALIDYRSDTASLTGNKSQVIFSTNEQSTGSSGFLVGITPVNTVFFEYYSNGSPIRRTSNQVLGEKNSVMISVSDVVTISHYDYENEVFVNNSFSINGYSASNKMYLGGSYDYSQRNLTGFKGTLQHFALFGNLISTQQDKGNCLDCFYYSGYDYVPGETVSTTTDVTGYSVTTVSISGVTGTGITEKTIQTEDGSKTVLVESGIEGEIASYDQYQILTGTTSSQTGYIYSTQDGSFFSERESGISLNFDYEAKSNQIGKSLIFQSPLKNEDFLEITALERPSQFFGLKPSTFSVSKSGKNSITVFNNGLLNVEGQDFGLASDGLGGFNITGFDYGLDDAFTYNIFDENVFFTLFSGQYPKSGSNNVYITGISGTVVTGYDIFANGQKIIESFDYEIGQTGSYPSVIIYEDEIPAASADSPVALIFVERPTGLNYNRYTKQVISDLYSYGFTGFSEQVWLNGVKQYKGADYIVASNSSKISGFDPTPKSFISFNNNIEFFGS